MDTIYDLVIVGAGPAGLSAAIYAQRARLNTVVLEQNYMCGGQVINTYEVDNYPGFPGISGFDLSEKFKEHADKLEATIIEAQVTGVELEENYKVIHTEDETYRTKALLIASGCHHKKLGVAGEEELAGMGVSYCATCDGSFFRNRTTCVVGGGDVAVEDAIFLARLCKKVYLIHRRDELRAAKSLQEVVKSLPNVEIVWDSIVETINGKEQVSSILVENVKTKEKKELEVDGVFVAVGIEPEVKAFDGLVAQDDAGYLIAGEDGKTSVDGIFVAGDVRTKPLRQIVTATADGANAITSVEKYLLTW
jgi:thioredoxin reductase (NADPH)